MSADIARLFLRTYDRLFMICKTYDQASKPEPVSPEDEAVVRQSQALALDIQAVFQKQLDGQQDLPDTVIGEIRYALAALADEILMYQIHWSGKDSWHIQLIEHQQFQSSVAGRRIFQNIQSLSKRYAQSPHLEAMARLYLMVLHLGFCGELRARPAILTNYRALLLPLTGLNDQVMSALPGQVNYAFDQAYRNTLSAPVGQKISAMRKWWKLGVLGILSYLVFTNLGWHVIVWQWRDQIEMAQTNSIISDLMLWSNTLYDGIRGMLP